MRRPGPEAFRQRFDALAKASGKSDRELAEAAGVSHSVVSGWRRGNGLPQTTDRLLDVVRTCISAAEAREVRLTVAQRNEDEWRALLLSAKEIRDQRQLPGEDRQPAGRPAARCVSDWSPYLLGVHRALTGSGATAQADLTPYLMRPHDRKLRTALTEIAEGGPSRLIVLTGASTTGKTRALFEAAAAIADGWPMVCPGNSEELRRLCSEHAAIGRSAEGRRPVTAPLHPQSVIWLDEAQRHIFDEDAALALSRLLAATKGIAVLATIWSHPYLSELLARGRSPDSHAAARQLLEGPQTTRIPVPERFEIDCAESESPDSRMATAIAAAADDGRVIQRLTGGPELVEAFREGNHFETVERALVNAAIDVRRLGFRDPIPLDVLQAAAEGYLSERERPGDIDWAHTALHGLTTGVRLDGTRTDIRNVITALVTIRAHAGSSEAHYEPEDYLLQELGRERRYDPGPEAVWITLADWIDRSRAVFLAIKEFEYRGYRRLGAGWWCRWFRIRASDEIAASLLEIVAAVDPHALRWAGRYLIPRMPLRHPRYVAEALKILRRDRNPDGLRLLMARAPWRSVDMGDAADVAELGDTLWRLGSEEEVTELYQRAARETSGEDLLGAILLARAMRRFGAHDVLREFGERCELGTRTDIEGPQALAYACGILECVHDPRVLAELVPQDRISRLSLDTAFETGALIWALADCVTLEWTWRTLRDSGIDPSGAEPAPPSLAHDPAFVALRQLMARGPEREVALGDTAGITFLLSALHHAGAHQAIERLIHRRPLERVVLDGGYESLSAAGRLLEALSDIALPDKEHRVDNDFTRPIHNAEWPATVQHNLCELMERVLRSPLVSPIGAASLVGFLHRAGAQQAAETLAYRAILELPLEDPVGVGDLLSALDKYKLRDQATEFRRRLRGAGIVRDGFGEYHVLAANESGSGPPLSLPFGLAVDGSPAEPWGWSDLYRDLCVPSDETSAEPANR
ncbi:hypothetical protein [Nocardia huaxiensis]|uniref:hypothetical protein n=1 Tax=Nocardia huaxiensis TaxID=2755382 RepID=UPI001E2BDB31|nr:hypothetical protein [Nocardia huaxiensis]UFS99400.1 hypothetical protein LPY97_16635 [Nocardia huaxiensis]